MRNGEPVPASAGPARGTPGAAGGAGGARVIETVVCPFHCLYQDALSFHTQSHLRLRQSESEAGRLARAALLLYVSAAEALVNQAAVDLARPDLARAVADPGRPLPTLEAWALLPAIVGAGPGGPSDLPDSPPWPQFAELLTLRASWAYPGPPESRRAYYRAPADGSDFEPLEPHQAPSAIGQPADRLVFPRTGLPRDPYALRPRHLDTARGVLDAAISALDRRLGGALTRDNRHRREPVRPVDPPAPAGRPSPAPEPARRDRVPGR